MSKANAEITRSCNRSPSPLLAAPTPAPVLSPYLILSRAAWRGVSCRLRSVSFFPFLAGWLALLARRDFAQPINDAWRRRSA